MPTELSNSSVNFSPLCDPYDPESEPDCLSYLEDPFVESLDLLEELKCFVFEDDVSLISSSCWDDCKSALNTITIISNAITIVKRSNSKGPVIGSRRDIILPQTPTEAIPSVYNPELGIILTSKIERYIARNPHSVRARETHSSPLRSRYRSATCIGNPEVLTLESKISLMYDKARQIHQKISGISECIDDTPQAKLLQIFSKHQRNQKSLSNTVWNQLFTSSVGTGAKTKGRHSLRYGNKNVMNLKQTSSASFFDQDGTVKFSKQKPRPALTNSMFCPPVGQKDTKLPVEGEEILDGMENKETSSFSLSSKPVHARASISRLDPPVFLKSGENTPHRSNDPKKRKAMKENAFAKRNSEYCEPSKMNRRPPVARLKKNEKLIVNEPQTAIPFDYEKPPPKPKKVKKLASPVVTDSGPILRSRSLTISQKRKSQCGSSPSDLRAGEGSEKWRESLRSQWDAEISTMSATKKVWYVEKEVDSLPFQSAPTNPGGFTQGLKRLGKRKFLGNDTRSREKIVKSFQKYRTQLEKEFVNCGMAIRTLRLQEKTHRQETKKNLKLYNSWHNNEIIEAYKELSTMQLLLIRTEISYEDKKSLIVNASLRKTKQAYILSQSEDVTKMLGSLGKSFVPIETLCSTPQTEKIRENIKIRQRLLKKLNKEFQSLLKDQASLVTQETRQYILLRTISGISSHPIISTFHEFIQSEQDKVDAVLLDQRCKTGMKILRLEEAIQATEIDEIPPHEIVDFLQNFVDETAVEFCVADDFLEILRLCVGRAVYPVLLPYLWDYHKEEHLRNDIIFQQQQVWLRDVTASELDPVLAPFESDLSLFQQGSSILEDLMFQTNPADMLMVLFKTMGHIHEIGTLKIGGDLGADDLFPMWLYITIHANVERIHSHMCFMEYFATPEDSMTQLGYCLTTFQACVAHICHVSQNDFKSTLTK